MSIKPGLKQVAFFKYNGMEWVVDYEGIASLEMLQIRTGLLSPPDVNSTDNIKMLQMPCLHLGFTKFTTSGVPDIKFVMYMYWALCHLYT